VNLKSAQQSKFCECLCHRRLILNCFLVKSEYQNNFNFFVCSFLCTLHILAFILIRIDSLPALSPSTSDPNYSVRSVSFIHLSVADTLCYVCSATHKDLAGNVFATMDRGLSASSDEGEEKVDSSNDDQRPPELQLDPKNSSVAHSDELASPKYSDDASVDKEDDDDDDDSKDEAHAGDASIDSGGSDGGESDIQSGADDDDNGDIASDASGKFSVHYCSLSMLPTTSPFVHI